MICSHCPNSNYAKTGVPSCFLPHCILPRTEQAKRFAELYWKPSLNKQRRIELEETEYQMLKAELKLNG